MAEKGFWQNQMAKVKAGESPALTIEQQQEREKPELEMQQATVDEGVGVTDVGKAVGTGLVGWAESTSEITQTPEMRRAASATVPGMLLSLADYVPVIRDTLVDAKRQTQQQFAETKESLKASMSESARKALEAELINDNLDFTDDATKLSTWIMKGTETIARMVPDLVLGGIGGKALYKETYDMALANGLSKGLTPEGAKVAANKIANAAMMAPTAIASTTSAQGGSGVQVRQTIESLPWKDLAQSDTFKQNFAQVDADPANEGMSNKEKLNLARTLTAEEASKSIMQDPALLTVNALASFIGDATLGKIVAGKLSGGIASKALTGVAAEAPTEAAQGAMEQYAQNLTLIDVAGQEIDATKGVAKAAIESGVMGGVIGGGIGAAGGVVDKVTGRQEEQVQEDLVQLEPELEAPEIIPEEPAKVDRSQMTVPERRAALEASLEAQREEMSRQRIESGTGEIQERLSRPPEPTAEELIIKAPETTGPTPGELEFRRQSERNYIEQRKDAKIPQGLKGRPNAVKMMNVGYRNALSDFGGLSDRMSKAIEPSAQTDTMSDAIAKMGGLNRKAAESEGFDPAMFKGNKTFSAKGTMTFDDAAESLNELGFTNREGKQLDSNDVVEMLYGEANNAEVHYSNFVNPEMMTGDAQLVRSWAKQIGGTDKLKNAVEKALNNEPLGKRQADIVEDMLDTINIMRTEGAEQAKERLEQSRNERAERRVNDFNALMKDAVGSDTHLEDIQSYSDMINEMPDHYSEEQVIIDELVATAGDVDFATTTSAIEQYESGDLSLPKLLTKLSDIAEQRVRTYAEAKPAIQKVSEPAEKPTEGVTAERIKPSEAAPAAEPAEPTARAVEPEAKAEPAEAPAQEVSEELTPAQKRDKRYAEREVKQAESLVAETQRKINAVNDKGGRTDILERNLNRQISGANTIRSKYGLGPMEVNEGLSPAPEVTEEVTPVVEAEQYEPAQHTTAKGKTLDGFVWKGVSKEKAKTIDPYTFKKGDGFFIREKHKQALDNVIAATTKPEAKAPEVEPIDKVEPEAVEPATVDAEAPKVVNASSAKTVRDKISAWTDIKFGDSVIDHRGEYQGTAVSDFNPKKPRAIKVRRKSGELETISFKTLLGSDVEAESIDAAARGDALPKPETKTFEQAKPKEIEQAADVAEKGLSYEDTYTLEQVSDIRIKSSGSLAAKQASGVSVTRQARDVIGKIWSEMHSGKSYSKVASEIAAKNPFDMVLFENIAEQIITPETQKAAIDKVVNQPEPEPLKVGETLEAPEVTENKRILDAVNSEVKAGFKPKNNNDLKIVAAKVFGVDKPSSVTNNQLKAIQEAFEAVSMVDRRAKINAILTAGKGSDKSVKMAYDLAVKSYENQPNLDVRTKRSSDFQAYSTPTPMSLLANIAAGVNSNTSVYEPTAGNGLLLVTANPEFTIANELDPVRASSLAWTGFDVTVNDATANNLKVKVDSVLANPPFGPMPKDANGDRPVVSFEDYQGKSVTLKEIDHVISRAALEAMKDNGKATLIIGANMKEPGVYKGNQKSFLNWLYSNYNVKFHIELDGSMYKGQGAAFPTQMIVIDGRARTGTGKFAPIKGAVKRIDNWSDLYDNFKEAGLLDSDKGNFKPRAKGDGVVSSNTESKTELREGVSRPSSELRVADRGDGTRAGDGFVKSIEPTGKRSKSIGKQTDGTVNSQPDIKQTGMVGTENIPGGGRTDAGPSVKTDAVRVPVKPLPESTGVNNKTSPKQIDVKVDKANDYQAHYKTASNGFNQGVLTPNNMASYTQAALSDIQERHGSVDKFVIDRLGYDGAEDLHKAFMGLQADAIALAVDNIENGRAIVIGDQTGVGKGRQAAGVIRYALQQGKTPIFVSQKPNLFTDMYDDLADIGVTNFTPLIMNQDNGFVSKGGKKLFNHSATERAKLLKQAALGSLPEGYNGLFLTYSQIASDSKGLKRNILDSLQQDAVIILDESHSAAGESKTGGFFQSLVNNAFGVTYLSATYAKRPDNMMLYMRTDLGLATDSKESLLDSVVAGGLGMQNYIAGKLAQAGQMVRRERSFDGISINNNVIPDTTGTTAKSFDKATSALRSIQSVSSMWAGYVETYLADYIQMEHGLDTSVGGNKADSNINVTSFSSVVHNNIAQLALSLKARETGRMAVKAIESGKRPVIALDNTLGSALQTYMSDNGLSIGDKAVGMNYATVLRNALDGVLAYSVKEPGAKKGQKFKMPISKIQDPALRAAYDRALKEINAMAKEDIPGSPIDAIRDEIKKAGYSVSEITGRNVMIDYANNNEIINRPSDEMDRRAVVDKFNRGDLDVLILNQAGSTGLSIHASEKFADQKPRHMIVAQPSLDINTYMQMLGRVNRTGQVALPSYDNVWLNLPSEKRPAAVLSRKMSSLNANTSGNTESATSVESVDILNQYGDQVVSAFVEANKDYLNQYNPKLTDVPDVDTAVYFLGKLAVLPVNVQEDVLGAIESEYRDLISYLDSTGQNELNMTEVDLDAKPISQKIISEGKKGAGVFSDPVYLTKVDAKAIGRSPTWDQVTEALAESNQDVFDKAISTAKKDPEFKNRLERRLSDLKETHAELVKAGKDTSIMDAAILEQENRIDDYLANVAEIENMFKPNGLYSYGSFVNVVIAEGESSVPGVIAGLSYKHESGNPYAASKWKMRVMVADRVNSLDIPLSMAKKGSIEGKRWDDARTMASRFNRESEKPARETRYIMTGNLVEAQSRSVSKGQIKPITLADGRIIQAMITPRSFSPDDGISKKVNASTSQMAKWLTETRSDLAILGVANRDNSVVIRRRWNADDKYSIEMPKSVQKGKKYWGDPRVEKIIGEQAVKGGGAFTVNIDESQMKKLVKAINEISPLAIKNDVQITDFNERTGKKEKDFSTRGIVFSQESIASGTPKGIKVPEASFIAKMFVKEYKGAAGVEVKVFQTQKEAMNYLGIDDDPNVLRNAVYVPWKSEVVLVADNLNSAKDAREKLRHEILAHHGLMRVVGQDEWQNIVNLVSMSRDAKSLSALWKEIDKKYQGLDENAKAEEVIAKIAEIEPSKLSEWGNRIIAAVIRALRKVGFITDKITQSEIRNIIRIVGERIKTVGNGYANIKNDIQFSQGVNNDPWAAENKKLREEDKTLWQQGKNILKRNLTPEGLLPNEVFNEKIKRDSEFEAVEFTARVLVGDFDKAIMKAYKMSFDYLPQATKNKLIEALSGKVANDIAPEVKASIIAMRQSIDGLSGEYINNIMDKMANEMAVNGRVSAADEALLTRISDNIGAYVNRSYKAFDDPKWFKKVPVETVNAARDYFVQRYIDDGETESESKRLSDIVVNEILKTGTAYDSMESFIAEGKLGAKDLSILMRKKVIDPEIRALLGEYDDPRINYVKSATKMGRLVWNERFLNRVLDIGMGSFLFKGKDRPANATKQIAGDQSETYSPLNGLWTFPEVEQAFKDSMGREQMSDLMRFIVRANGAVKYGKTVLSPTTAMRNFQSAMFFALANGHFNLSKIKDAMTAVRVQVTDKATPADIGYFVKLKRLGVVYDAPYAKEMARLLGDSEVENMLSSKFGDGSIKSFTKLNDFAQNFYSFGDDFWKIVGFENEKASLLDAGMSVGEAEIEAAKRIRNTYPTYSMTGKAIKSLSRFPLAGTFVSFPAEIVRTSINMIKTVNSDIKSSNPKMRALGYKRIAGITFVSSAFFALNAATKAMLGVTDDEEEAIRNLSAPWQKNSTFAYVGRDKKNNLQYFDMSFLDPYGYFKRPITAMLRDQPWQESATSALADLISPFLGADIVAQSIFEILANKKGTGSQVYNENGMPSEQLEDISIHLGKTVAPGFIGNAVRIYKALDGQVSSSGKPYKFEEEMLSLVGWRLSTMDPKTSLHYKTFEFSDGIKKANRTIMKKIQDVNKVSDDDLMSAYESAKKQHDTAFNKMIRLTSAAKNSGMTKAAIFETLKRSGVSDQNAKMVIFGKTPPFKLSRSSAENAINKARVSIGREHAKRVRDRVLKVMKQ